MPLDLIYARSFNMTKKLNYFIFTHKYEFVIFTLQYMLHLKMKSENRKLVLDTNIGVGVD